jgi:hypothetical protein
MRFWRSLPAQRNLYLLHQGAELARNEVNQQVLRADFLGKESTSLYHPGCDHPNGHLSVDPIYQELTADSFAICVRKF